MKTDSAYLKTILLRICRQDDTRAFEELFKMFYERLLNFSECFTDSRELAEEATSDVFVKLWQNRKTLDNILNPESYLYRAVKNQSLNYSDHLSNRTVSAAGDLELADLIDKFDPEKELELRELEFDIEVAVNSLPPQCRLVFKLIKEDGFRYHEVAEILNISPRTVETQLIRALKKLDVALALHKNPSRPMKNKLLPVLLLMMLSGA